jgi:hypothetical protein
MDPMKIDSEAQAVKAIEVWRQDPPLSQKRTLRLAIESLELSVMYYEQKDNLPGIKRMEGCLAILQNRLQELDAV